MTSISLILHLQFGQISIAGSTEQPFLRPTKCRGGRKALPWDWVPVSLKSKSWSWLGRFATAARSPILLCAHYSQESRKKKQVTALAATPTTFGGSKNPCVDADAVWRGLKMGGQGSRARLAMFVPACARSWKHGQAVHLPDDADATPGGDRRIYQIHSWDKRKPRISVCDRAIRALNRSKPLPGPPQIGYHKFEMITIDWEEQSNVTGI